MDLDLSLLRPQERLALQLRTLYERGGFRQYHLSHFEEYSVYQENRSFLGDGQILTFTDLDGRLLALKPDVTLSLVKNAPLEEGGRFWYLENVYRPSRESHTFREIRQMGLESIGEAGGAAEVAALAAETMAAAGEGGVLELGHIGFVAGLLRGLGVPSRYLGEFLEKVGDKRYHDLETLAEQHRFPLESGDLARRLDELTGPWRRTVELGAQLAAEPALPPVERMAMEKALSELRALCESLEARGLGERVRLNLSLTGNPEYYNGLLLRGFLPGLPRAVLRGGQYDYLATRLRPGVTGAIGFGLYLDELERPPMPEQVLVNVALPKGRLGDKVMNLLSSVGYGCEEDYNASRKLVVENPQAGIRYFLVKPSDVSVYVEHGAADIGIVGKDILAESGADVYELLDTGLGRCRMCEAGLAEGAEEDASRPLRVATKFVNIAKSYYAAQGREIDIIKLNGSIELAPLLGLSDVIVDIVETGTTLRENGLAVRREILDISARLIANRASYQFKRRAIDTLAEKLREVTARDKD